MFVSQQQNDNLCIGQLNQFITLIALLSLASKQILLMIQEPPQVTYIKGNRRGKANHRIFSIALIALQILISLLYGFYGNIQIKMLNLNSVFTAIFLAFLSVVGFGMYFGLLKSLLWGSIGFSFLIIALSIQVYPLVNALFAKASIHSNPIFSDSFSNKNFSVFLANLDSSNYQGNTITSAIKCGLAIIVGFGSVIGRVGPLECLIMTAIGNIGYQLNRNICIDIGQDLAGTFTIFTFGGFLGLTFGIIMAIREKRKNVVTFKHPMLVGSIENVTHSIIGILFVFVLFPFLAYEGDQSLQAPFFQRYTSPVSVVLSMGSSIVSSVGTGMLIHGSKFKGIRIKDIMNSVVGGGVGIGAASFYITTPFLAIIVGSMAGISQYILDNYLQKQLYLKLGLFSTSSYTLFCVQGLVGAVFAAGYNNRMANHNNGFTIPTNLKNPGWQIIIYLISTGFGIACGLVTGIACYFLNKYTTKDMFTDVTEFIAQDGIHYLIEKKKLEVAKPIQPQPSEHSNPQQQKEPEGSEQGQRQPNAQSQVSISDPQSSQVSDISFDFADMLQVAMQ